MPASLFPNPDDYSDWKDWANDYRRVVNAASKESLPVVASPVLLSTHTPRASAVTPGILMYDSVNKEPIISDGTKWSNITTAGIAGGGSGGGLRWISNYTVGSPRREGDLVRDEGWLMRANKNTLERAAPLGAGASVYVSGYSDTPPWVPILVLGNYFITGQRYTITDAQWLTSVRYWYPSDTRRLTFELWVVITPLTDPGIRQVFGPFLPSASPVEQWEEFALKPAPLNAGTLDVILVATPNAIPVTINGTWDQQNTDTSPIAGKMAWHDDEVTVEFNNTDKNGTDQTMSLNAVPPGATFFASGASFLVITVVIGAGITTFTILPVASRPSQGNNRAFQWSYFIDGPLEYVEIFNHYLGAPGIAVKGFQGSTYSFDIALNDNGYGIDISLDPAVVSPDWDILSYSDEISEFPS